MIQAKVIFYQLTADFKNKLASLNYFSTFAAPKSSFY